MTAQDLKNSILQLAVQGKLVPQDPNDEPASELLKRIKAEKETLIEEGKIVIDKKHTPSLITNDDIPYKLPDNWQWVRFADIVSFYSGKTPERHTTSYWSNGQYSWVAIADMVSDGITVETKEKISQIALSEYFSDKLTPAGTIIMSFKLTIGKISILGIDAVHNEAIISIFPFIDNSVLKDYLFIVLPLISNSGNFKNAVKGKTLNATSISNLMIPLPPLAEQERIVSKIEELMPLIEEYGKLEEQRTKLDAEFPEKLRKSILQQAIQGKLTERNPADEPTSELLKRIRAEKEQLIKEGKIKKEKPLPPIAEEEIPFEIPENWSWARLGNLVSVYGGKRVPAGRKLINNDTGHKYIRVLDMKEESVSLDNIMFLPEDIYQQIKQYNIHKEDVFITVAGTIGRIGSVPIELDGANLTENADKLVFTDINQGWLIKCLTSPELQLQIENATKKEGQPKLAIARIRNLIVPLPPVAEQQRIVDRVNELLALCDELK